MSTAWPSPERLPAAVERSGAPSSTLGCTTDDVVAIQERHNFLRALLDQSVGAFRG